jgi:6-phosphogluconolactonase (cycloisomerase 2 family)
MDQLFLISYRGTITTLGFFHDASAKDALRELASTRACEPNPSWISLDAGRRILYCTEGGMASGKGALKAFRIESDGSLTETSSVETPCGAAHHILYNHGNAMVVAY